MPSNNPESSDPIGNNTPCHKERLPTWKTYSRHAIPDWYEWELPILLKKDCRRPRKGTPRTNIYNITTPRKVNSPQHDTQHDVTPACCVTNCTVRELHGLSYKGAAPLRRDHGPAITIKHFFTVGPLHN
ncbi:hypothetical protein J6590_018227 [Homalodisca vitripennis]|nr:hypothetical protein J6590_018227 [Homalodisca vitripennis]